MMNIKNIDGWMLLLLAVLLTACHSDSKEEIVQPVEEDCYLDIYVYAPGRPIVTRADVGEIDPISDDESKVTTLQIWVFRHSDAENAKAVGYLDADPTFLNEKKQQKYQLLLDKSFANNPQSVDVYVVANTATCGLAFDENTTRSDLNDAKIGKGEPVSGECYFGPDEKVSVIPSDGIPMSAVLKNQPITGLFPTLRIGNETDGIVIMELTRAVSKLRFVLCRIKEKETTSKKLVSIDGIQLNGNQIPTQTYLMPGTYSYANKYVEEAIVYVNEDNKLLPRDEDIPQVDNPLVYAYETQNAQDYEDLIDAAVKPDFSWLRQYGTEKNIPELAGLIDSDKPQLKQIGLTYLRESDKQLTGTIRYKYRENGKTEDTEDTADFFMAAPGDFLRNHSWIIYVYYMDSKIYTLTVTTIGMKRWTDDGNSETTTFYNW